jgi:8-oxo-dGTP pyrophosphatase MutT (NUDIX family)
MTETNERTMLVLDAGVRRFQVRACALIRDRDHVLIHRAVPDTIWALPGGRVEHGEPAAEALQREVREEIGCDATVGPLRFVIENFFHMGGRDAHELGFYFDVTLAEPLAFITTDVVLRSRDGDADLEFRWVRPSAAELTRWNLRPVLLREMLEDVDGPMQHRVHRDASLKDPL